MEYIVHKADTRIVNDFGWLRISASFREDAATPDRQRFGTLLIVDDALMIPGGRGFALHPHDNMEIISWVLSGTDEHNGGTDGINLIRSNEVQLLSAGTGIEHAENNLSEQEAVHMFQIWIKPKNHNVAPRYQTKSLTGLDRTNKLLTFISPDGKDSSLVINQDAYVSITALDPGKRLTYEPKLKTNGLYVLVLFGTIELLDLTLSNRDAIAIKVDGPAEVMCKTRSEILFIEVPLE
jgi:redox-sensitive bicupin YhaK (pirin superfamily)